MIPTIATITKAEAFMIFDEVCRYYADDIAATGTSPSLHIPGFHCSSWSISWEGSGYDCWALHASEQAELYPAWVLAEPVAAPILGLYNR